MKDVLEFLNNNLKLAAIIVAGITISFVALTVSCSRVMEAEYQYKIERNKTFWAK